MSRKANSCPGGFVTWTMFHIERWQVAARLDFHRAWWPLMTTSSDCSVKRNTYFCGKETPAPRRQPAVMAGQAVLAKQSQRIGVLLIGKSTCAFLRAGFWNTFSLQTLFMLHSDPEQFRRYYRIMRNAFERLHTRLETKLTKQYVVREPISSRVRLAITLR